MAAIGTYDFPAHRKNDTFKGRTFTISKNGVALDLTGAAIKITFRYNSPTGETTQILQTGAGVTITNATAGEYKIDKQVIAWTVGTWYYDIQITLGNGDIFTWVKGVFPVEQDITV